MKNNIIYSVFIITIFLFSSCSNKEKVKNTPAPSTSKKSLINAQHVMTTGQKHNLIVEEYLAQYGATTYNSITPTEVETVCERMATIADQQGLLENFTVTEISHKIMEIFEKSDAFQNGILKTSDELITATIEEIPNDELKEAHFYIHNLALQNDPDFVSKSFQRLNQLNSLTQQEQAVVNGFKSILESSFSLWSNPNSIYTNGGNDPRVRPTTETDGLAWVVVQFRAGRFFNEPPGSLNPDELTELGFIYSGINSYVETTRP